MNDAILMMHLFIFLNMKNSLNLKIVNHERIQTIIQAIISSGQWTQAITLDRSIITKNGSIKYADFLYPSRNNAVRKDDDTAAWSEGKDASGIWFSKNCHALCKKVSGLSIWTIFCKIKFIEIAIITQ